LDDRVFISTLSGLGATLLDLGPLRGGVAINYGGGRNSSDSTRLKGLSNVSGGAEIAGFLSYSLKPFAFEIKAQNLFGPNPGTEVSADANVTFLPLAGLRVSVGPQITWADSRYDRAYFGVTADEAARATAEGNPLRAYTPGAGIKDIGLSANVLYQLTDHWGLSAHLGVVDLVGSAPKDSPLTQRQFQPMLGIGATYRF
jgi:outer membrane scaffolding protein for murein synthesis (MipA/OmpV family)